MPVVLAGLARERGRHRQDPGTARGQLTGDSPPGNQVGFAAAKHLLARFGLDLRGARRGRFRSACEN